MTTKMDQFPARNPNQDEHKIYRYNRILEGINRIISIELHGNKKEERINTCLSVALEITGSQICFIGEIDCNGFFHKVNISNETGNQYNKLNKSDYQYLQRDFILNCLYGRVIENKISNLNNYPLSSSNKTEIHDGHPSLKSFLGAPLLAEGKAIGVIAVANREGGYSLEERENLEAIVPVVTQTLRRIKEECDYKQAENALQDAYEQIQAQSDEIQMHYEEIHRINETLEAKVKERTEELEEAYNSLREIETVRKQEIHHRIKNNLQVISSLLDLQAEKFKGKKIIDESQVLDAFRESQDRVISMALIHEELHKGGKIDTLNFSAYIQELANNLILSYRLGNEDIVLDMDIDDNIFFDMDTAIPLGIIINELISNSLKHAFPDKDNGKIQIKLHREECKNPSYILSVSDNGVGILEDLDIEDLDSLGLQLVTTLVDQLDGELEIKRVNGTEFIIRFSLREE